MTTQSRRNRTIRLSARKLRIAVVVSTFNESITSKLLEGALSCLMKHGATTPPTIVRCPGAFELPQVAGVVANQKRWDAIICLGAVIRGETPHFTYVAAEAARGIQDVALRTRVPVVFGVLTTNTMRQANERSGGKHGNKGWDAALAAIEMAVLFQGLKRNRRR